MKHILRCRGGDTLALAAALADHGMEGWSPIWHQRMRLPRARKVVTVSRPMLPSFVFLPHWHTGKALAFAERYTIPSCSLFRVNGAAATVGEDGLSSLRELELVASRTDVGQALPVGTWVDVMGGPLVGMSGAVVGGSHGYTLVSLERWTSGAGKGKGLVGVGRVNVPTFLLRAAGLYGDGHGA